MESTGYEWYKYILGVILLFSTTMFGVLLTNTINQKKKLEAEKKADPKVEATYNMVMAGFVVSLAFTVGFFVWLAQSYFMKRGKEMAVLGAIVGSSAVAGVTGDSQSFTGNGLIESRATQPVSTETRTVPVETMTVPVETRTVTPALKPVPVAIPVSVETRTVQSMPVATTIKTAVPVETRTTPTVQRTAITVEPKTLSRSEIPVARTEIPVELKSVDEKSDSQRGPALKAEDILKDNTQFGKAIIDKRILPLLNNRDVKAKYDNTIMNSPRLSPDSKKMIENYMAGKEDKSAKLYEILEDILGGISLGDMTFRMKEYAMDVLKESNSLNMQGRLDPNFNRLSEQQLADIYSKEFKPYPIGDKKIPSKKFTSVIIAGTTPGKTVIEDMQMLQSRYKIYIDDKYKNYKNNKSNEIIEIGRGAEKYQLTKELKEQVKKECNALFGEGMCGNVEKEISDLLAASQKERYSEYKKALIKDVLSKENPQEYASQNMARFKADCIEKGFGTCTSVETDIANALEQPKSGGSRITFGSSRQ